MLETGEQEGVGEPTVLPELPETEPAELESAYEQPQPLETPELLEGPEEGQLEEGEAEEAAELVEALSVDQAAAIVAELPSDEQADLPRQRLPEDLVDVAAVVGVRRLEVRRAVDEVLVDEEVLDDA